MPLFHTDNVDIPYTPVFDYKDLTLQTLYITYDDNTSRKAKTPMFDSKYGIEALLLVEREFRKTMTNKFNLTDDVQDGPDWFRYFDEIVINDAANRWNLIADTIAEGDRTIANFNESIQQYYRAYCGTHSRDSLIQYLQTVRKPVKMDPRGHSARMQQLADYANKLPGDMPELNAFQVKQYIYNSFPDSWRHAFQRAGKRVATETLPDIIEYMTNEKEIADQESAKKKAGKGDDTNGKNGYKRANGRSSRFSKKKKTTHGSDSSDGEGSSNSQRGGRSNRPDPNGKCPLHPDGNHIWKKCFLNVYGDNFRPPTNREGGGRTGNNRNPPRNTGDNYHQETRGNGHSNERSTGTSHDTGANEQHHYDHIGPSDHTRVSWSPSTISSRSTRNGRN